MKNEFKLFLRAFTVIATLFFGTAILHGPDANAASNLTGCVAGQNVTQAASGGPMICAKGATLTLSARAVNIATTGDVGLIAFPAGVTKYQILNVFVTNCTVTPVLAQPNVNTAASGGGTSVVDAGVITGASSSGIILPLTLTTIAQTNAFIATSLTVNMTVANVAAGTCDFYATIKDLT